MKLIVYGTPRPQGSMRSFYLKTPNGNHPVMTSDNRKLKPWRQEVAATAMQYGAYKFGRNLPVEISMDFYFSRPKSASLKKRPGMTVKPDADKLVRAIFDAITGILIEDDAQIVSHHARKFYGDPERVEIEVTPA